MKKTHKETWSKIAEVFRLALKIYAFSSLSRPNDTMPQDRASRENQTTTDRAAMLEIIDNLPHEPLVRYALVWPLVIAGVYASSKAHRNTIVDSLLNTSRLCGMSTPLQAKRVLEKFWQSEACGWDDCFDEPYAFLA